MNIVIRTDASAIIGSGHVMRCLTLANALKQSGHHVLFICREYPENLNSIILENKFELKTLFFNDVALYQKQIYSNDYSRWLWVSQQQDSDETILLLQSMQIDWLVVDHYSLDIIWEKQLRAVTKHIMVIDDLDNRHHDCDILLNQNLQALPDLYQNLIPKECELLLGTQYALLRPEFVHFREQSLKKKRNQLQRIFVFFGGSDTDNVTEMVLNALLESTFSGEIDVVLGKNNSHAVALKKQFSAYAFIHIYQDVQNMSELMSRADLCVGAGGATSWERCCLGLPSVIITIAANQKSVANALASLNAARYLGDAKTISISALSSVINEFILHPVLLEKMSLLSKEWVDGLGVKRVLKKMLKQNCDNASPCVFLRKAEAADVELVFHLRNHPLIRERSFSYQELKLDEHKKWFDQSLENTNRQILIASDQQEKFIGVVRFDFIDDYAEVSIYIDPDLHGHGYGSLILDQGVQWVTQHRHAKSIIAKVMHDNVASHKIFLKTGFVEKYTYYEINLDK